MTLSMYITRLFVCVIILTFLCESINPVFAEETTLSDSQGAVHIELDAETTAKGYEVLSTDEAFRLSFAPGVISGATALDIHEIPAMPGVWRMDRVSNVYQFEISNKEGYDGAKPLSIQIAVPTALRTLTQIFYYNTASQTWKPLPTQASSDGLYVRASIHFAYARVAAFSYPDILVTGQASWYAHKKGNFAASPDFPKGSRVRVRNVATGAYVDVTINDYGPDRGLFPNRVIDLEKNAFSRIAKLGAGIIQVRVEPLSVVAVGSAVLGVPPEGIGPSPQISAKAALVMDEDSGTVLYEKNADEPLPIASLSKLIAVRVFLDTRPSLNTVVSYNVQDEKLNHQYVDDPSEAARLKVKHGETMTIQDLIYASLVGSANNTIESLVRISGMTRAEFIQKMNESAVRWGATTAHFDDPAGLSPKNTSSARDFALLAREAFRNPIIQKATTTKVYTFSTINTKKAHRIKNTNPIVVSGSLELIGSKTGFLYEAGYCLVTRMKSQGRNIIAIALGDSNRGRNFTESATLMQYGKKMAQKNTGTKQVAAK